MKPNIEYVKQEMERRKWTGSQLAMKMGVSRMEVRGLTLCGFAQLYSGPLESLLASISAIFKVLLSLFFMAYFS